MDDPPCLHSGKGGSHGSYFPYFVAIKGYKRVENSGFCHCLSRSVHERGEENK